MSGEERNAKRDQLLALGLDVDLVEEWLDPEKRQAWLDAGLNRLEAFLAIYAEFDAFLKEHGDE